MLFSVQSAVSPRILLLLLFVLPPPFPCCMRKSSNREKMTPVPTPAFSRHLSASELADQFDDLNPNVSDPSGAKTKSLGSKTLQTAHSSSPRQQHQIIDQSFLAFRAAGSTSTLLSGASSASSHTSSTCSSASPSVSSSNANTNNNNHNLAGQEDDFVVSSATPRRNHRPSHPYHGHYQHSSRPSATVSKERYVFSK